MRWCPCAPAGTADSRAPYIGRRSSQLFSGVLRARLELERVCTKLCESSAGQPAGHHFLFCQRQVTAARRTQLLRRSLVSTAALEVSGIFHSFQFIVCV